MAFIFIEQHVEDSLLVVRKIRQLNPEMEIYTRMFDDEIAYVLEDLGSKTFSTSRFAFSKIKDALEAIRK